MRVLLVVPLILFVLAGHAGAVPWEGGGQVAGAEIDRVAVMVQWQAIQAVVDYTTWYWADQAEKAAEAQAAAQAAQAVRTPHSVSQGVSAGAGYPSEAFWREVARCEESGQNHPVFGYFGKIDGAWAGQDWATQVAEARDLWNATIAAGRDISKVWTSYPSCTGPVF